MAHLVQEDRDQQPDHEDEAPDVGEREDYEQRKDHADADHGPQPSDGLNLLADRSAGHDLIA